MSETSGRNSILSLKQKWTKGLRLASLMVMLSISIIISFIAIRVFFVGYIMLPVSFLLVWILSKYFNDNKINERDIAKFLNKSMPVLEESAELLLESYDKLNYFEKLQVNKINAALEQVIQPPPLVKRKIKQSGILLIIVILACIVTYIATENYSWNSQGNNFNKKDNQVVKAESILPQITQVSISITPPAYTRKAGRTQDKFNIMAEEGAQVTWHLNTTTGITTLAMIMNDKSSLKFKPVNRERTKWTISRKLNKSGFYQLSVNDTISELYKLEMIKDQPPVIIIQSPNPQTLIAPGYQPRTLVNVSLSDDYGVKISLIAATIASGSGEAVKFKEQEIYFPAFTAGRKTYQLQKQIDLTASGLKPGDELYFYVLAIDTYNQKKRSAVYIIRIEDTTELMSMEGLASGTNIKPEFFRSQRQIIIETAQLLRVQDTISADEFKKRSNNLGIDQQLLRLRYGKFLGEETNVEIGKDNDHQEEEHAGTEDFGNAEKMMEGVAHTHDNAEDASFFDAATKKQLKATLAEMWKAELQLRTLKPKAALPFEYSALKLLKDLQQQTRVYVGKTGIKMTPLNPDKRLTGELDKINQPSKQENIKQKNDGVIIMRKALGILEQLKHKEKLPAAYLETLVAADLQLSSKAAAEPSVYLSSLESFKRILINNYKLSDITLAGSALQRMITASGKLPAKATTGPDMHLSEQYFKNLKQRNE